MTVKETGIDGFHYKQMNRLIYMKIASWCSYLGAFRAQSWVLGYIFKEQSPRLCNLFQKNEQMFKIQLWGGNEEKELIKIHIKFSSFLLYFASDECM